MLDESLQIQAALYASGALDAGERAQFELLLEFDLELRIFAAELLEATTGLALASIGSSSRGPSSGLRSRILDAVSGLSQAVEEGFVMTGADGLVRYVNATFSGICGYTLDELQGRKLGPILQGRQTDPSTVEKVRTAVQAFQACSAELLNYHKDGHPYWVQIEITPIFTADGAPRCFVARERELKDRPLPVG